MPDPLRSHYKLYITVTLWLSQTLPDICFVMTVTSKLIPFPSDFYHCIHSVDYHGQAQNEHDSPKSY